MLIIPRILCQNTITSFRSRLVYSLLSCGWGKLQVRVAGHRFTIAERSQTFTNANIGPKKKIFKPKVSIFVKVWVVSVMVKQWPATLTCSLPPSVVPFVTLQFTPFTKPQPFNFTPPPWVNPWLPLAVLCFKKWLQNIWIAIMRKKKNKTKKQKWSLKTTFRFTLKTLKGGYVTLF